MDINTLICLIYRNEYFKGDHLNSYQDIQIHPMTHSPRVLHERSKDAHNRPYCFPLCPKMVEVVANGVIGSGLESICYSRSLRFSTL